MQLSTFLFYNKHLLEYSHRDGVDTPLQFGDYNIGLNEMLLKEYQEKGVKLEIIEGI